MSSSGSQSFWKTICIVALFSLVHCAYSAAQHRSYLRLVGQPFTYLPIDLVIQTLVSLVVFVLAASYVAGDFQAIRSDIQATKKSWDTVGNCPSFYVFEHRAKCLSPKCHKFTDSKAPVKEVSSKRREKVEDPKVLEDALNYCSEMVKQRDYENYLAALLMPKAARPRVISTLALNAEVSVIRQKIKRNSGVTGIYQLQFWKDALETVAGQKPGPVPKQPVVKALQAFADVASDLELYLKLVSARQQTLGDRSFPCVSDLEANCEQIFGSLILLTMNALNTSPHGSRPSDNNTCRKAASSLGKSVGILTLLRATIPLLKEGVVLLPNDLLVLHGLSPDTVYKNKNPDGLKNLTKDLCMVASKYRQDARVAKDVPKELRLALLPSAVRVDHLLNTLTNNGFNLFDARLQQRHPLLSWKLWWGSFRGYN